MLLHMSHKGDILSLITKAQLVACLTMVWLTWTSIWFPLITLSVMALEAVKFHLYFKFLCLYVLFFLYSHSRMRGEQLVSQCETLKIR
jgi:hypothetical protein